MTALAPVPRRMAEPAGLGPRRSLSAAEKAAVILAALGPEAAGPVIERVGDRHLRAFARAYANLTKIPQAELIAVIEEFVASLGSGAGEALEGGAAAARALLGKFKDNDELNRLMGELDAETKTVWQRLEEANETALVSYLNRQKPQALAVILSKLDVEKASRLLGCFDPELAQDIIIRLAQPIKIGEDAAAILALSIDKEFLTPLKFVGKTPKPGEIIGALMNNLPSERRAEILSFIMTNTPDIVKDMRKTMLTFPDLPIRVPATAIPNILRSIDPDTFLKAVKYGRENAPRTVDFIFANISQRMVQQYEEQLGAMTQVSKADAEAAQAAFMSSVRAAATAGEFALIDPKAEGEEDQSN